MSIIVDRSVSLDVVESWVVHRVRRHPTRYELVAEFPSHDEAARWAQSQLFETSYGLASRVVADPCPFPRIRLFRRSRRRA